MLHANICALSDLSVLSLVSFILLAHFYFEIARKFQMDKLNLYRFFPRAMVVYLTVLLFLIPPAYAVENSIEVIPDEYVDGTVELTPGYISGAIDIGGQAVNRIDLTAVGGDNSAKANLTAEGNYELTVNVPKGGSLGYTLNGMAYMNSYNTRLYFKERSTVVEEGGTSKVDIIINAGYVVGTVVTEGCTVSQGEVWAILDTEAGYTKAYTKFGSDGMFRLPVQPNSGIRVYGQVQLSGGATYQLQSKYIDVAPAREKAVQWDLICAAGEPGAIDHNTEYHFDMDYHYSYLYYQGASSPYKTVKHEGNVFFDNIAPGAWRLYTYSYWNNGRNLIAKYLNNVNVSAGETVLVDIDTVSGFVQGNITLKGTHTLEDTTAAYLYGYGKNAVYPSYQTTSRAFVESGEGAYNLALPQGDWDIYTSIYYFNNTDPGQAHLQSYLYMYDYKRRENPVHIEAGQTLQYYNITYETGSATIKYRRSDGGTYSRPHVKAKSFTYDDSHRLEEYVYTIAHGEADGDTVTFVGFPGTYEVEAWAYVNQSLTTFGKVDVQIIPGVDKVVDIGGPELTLQTPTPGFSSEAETVVVTGTATDDSGVKAVLVNGEPAEVNPTNNPADENEVSFTIEIQLAEGENSIETLAMDFSGNESSDKRMVTYTIPEATLVDVAADIKPGSCKNPFNLKSKGVLPVVIIGGDGFNAADIDPATITLNGISPVRWTLDDVATTAAAQDSQCDTDHSDGIDDVVLKFDTQAIVASLGSVAEGDVVTLPLSGALLDGTEIAGQDIVTVLKKGSQNTGKKK